MSAPQTSAGEELLIGAEAVKARLQSGAPMTVLDSRNDKAWESSPIKVRDAIRIPPSGWRIDPSWPKDRLMVVY
jgi:hypothetical protein